MQKKYYYILIVFIFLFQTCMFQTDSQVNQGDNNVTEPKGANNVTEPMCPDYPIQNVLGKVYYICDCDSSADADCQVGNDQNDGLSPSSSWQSYERARTQFNVSDAGDMIAFCRGGYFKIGVFDSTKWVNGSCKADLPCIVRDYQPPWGSGDEPNPIIKEIEGKDAFKFENNGDPEHEEGYVFLNLRLEGPGAGSGFSFFNDIDDVTICNTTINFFGIGVHIGGSNAIDPNNQDPNIDGKNERISLLLSTITNNTKQGFLGGCNDCKIENSYFENNGYGRSIFNHNIYLSHSNGAVYNMRVAGNELYRSAFVDNKCQGVSLVVHGQYDNLTIENNTVREDINGTAETCFGIAVDTGYTDVIEGFRNISIKGNRVINVGGTGIGLNGCQNCVIENNLIVNEQANYNVYGIRIPDRSRENADLSMEQIIVRNNYIYYGNTAKGTAITLGGEGENHQSTGNQVYYAGANDFKCFKYDQPANSYNEIDYNACYLSVSAPVIWEENTGSLLQDWQTNSSLDQHSVVSDPGFMVESHEIYPYIGTTPVYTAPSPDITPDTPTYEPILQPDATPDIAVPVCSDYLIGSSGTVYYVCDCEAGSDVGCQIGNDSNNGLFVDVPWRTYAKAQTQFSSLSAGDTIAFCRGGAFEIDSATTDIRWTNNNCRANSPCIIRDYDPLWASGDEAAPIFSSTATAFELTDSGTPEHEEGYIFLNLDIRGSGSDTAFFFYNDIDYVTLCNLKIDSFAIGVHIAGSNPLDPDETDPKIDGKNEHISLINSQITNNSKQGYLGACNHCLIQNNIFQNNGFATAIFNHNIYISGLVTPDGVHDMRVIGNQLYQSAFIDGKCQGVSLVAHGKIDTLMIEGNEIHEDVGTAAAGCYGIAIDAGYNETEGFKNVTIRRNKVTYLGAVGIGISACQDCLIENNIITNEQQPNYSQAAIAASDRLVAYNDLTMERVTIRNNSIFLGAETRGTGIRLGGDGYGHRSVSNVVYYAGTGAFQCFDYSLHPVLYFDVGNNICYFPNAASGKWETRFSNISTWQNYSSLDQNSQVVDPLFTSDATPDLDLSPQSTSSPLYNSGYPGISSEYDFDGNDRDGNPDIGAIEFF